MLSRQDARESDRWLTRPANDVEDWRCFPSIRAAIEYWDERARWVAYDTALAKVLVEHAMTLDLEDRAAFDQWIDVSAGSMPEVMTNLCTQVSFPSNWKEVIQGWVAREGSIARVDISQVLKHARSEQKAPSLPSEREAKNDHRMAERRDYIESRTTR
ncbi:MULTISPECIES: hypothetical protein [Xanthomonas]|uniref:hypothetical protein n=1 Tax=Xanthomonas TaxID=338 RepID=UPI00111555A8|nr:hypothetical protein [Xanthomonas campestris]MCC5095369.1 hypothetical protein [Xanthomonas campestris pv. incanae]MEA9613157.1 hypothetical protein [Xanthomonas campestris pv. incanae]WDJ09146.1 hypothetical protein JH299_16310 [Xanthomonas campestris pv. incanae]